jgi:AraC-like DNA-binding protein
VLPDGTVTLFFTLRDGRLAVHAAPPRAEAFESPSGGLPERLVGVRICCGAAPLLLDPPLATLDPTVPVDDRAWRALSRAQPDGLRRAGTADERLAWCERALSERLAAGTRATHREAGRIVVAALASSPEARIEAVARDVGVTERHLRRMIRACVGLGPKALARVWRLRRALVLAQTRRWADVAAEAGYCDQAHMAGEFRSMTGLSPTSFTRLWAFEPSAHSMGPAGGA